MKAISDELAAEAGQIEKRKRIVQLAKKIGISLKRRCLPLEGNHLFHSELAVEAGQTRKAEADRLQEAKKSYSRKIPSNNSFFY
jgi:hypothetical protein